MPNETNAHPHFVDGVAVVHNGIIENFSEIKRRTRCRRCTSSRRRPTPKSSRSSWSSISREGTWSPRGDA
ncbi:MAG: hypothetical protein KL839_03310 [Rhizobium sp.]|nr:hypothetical protein [Rhizobium sp.]